MMIFVLDGLGNLFIKIIFILGGSVMFDYGDGDLQLDGIYLNLMYSIDICLNID